MSFCSLFHTPVYLLIQCNTQVFSVLFLLLGLYYWLYRFIHNFVLDNTEGTLHFGKVVFFFFFFFNASLQHTCSLSSFYVVQSFHKCTLYSIIQGCQQKQWNKQTQEDFCCLSAPVDSSYTNSTLSIQSVCTPLSLESQNCDYISSIYCETVKWNKYQKFYSC